MQNLPILTSPRAEIKPPEAMHPQSADAVSTSFQQVLTQQKAQKDVVQAPVKTAAPPSQQAAAQANKKAHQADTKPDKTDTLQKKPTKPAIETDDNTAEATADLSAFINIANKTASTTKGEAIVKPSKTPKNMADDTQATAALTNASMNDAMIAALHLPVTNTNAAASTSAQTDNETTHLAPALAASRPRQQESVLPETREAPVGNAEPATASIALIEHGPQAGASLDQRFVSKLTTALSHSEPATQLPPLTTFNQPLPTPLLAAANELANPTVINAYPGKAGWDQAISQKVVWMVGQAEQSATLTLNPPDLGPLQVVIHVNHDKADTTFISDHPEVRKALENGMAHLRQSMDQAGIQLGQTNINDSRQSPQYQQAPSPSAYQPAPALQAEEASFNPVTKSVRIQQGLVDTFA